MHACKSTAQHDCLLFAVVFVALAISLGMLFRRAALNAACVVTLAAGTLTGTTALVAAALGTAFIAFFAALFAYFGMLVWRATLLTRRTAALAATALIARCHVAFVKKLTNVVQQICGTKNAANLVYRSVI